MSCGTAPRASVTISACAGHVSVALASAEFVDLRAAFRCFRAPACLMRPFSAAGLYGDRGSGHPANGMVSTNSRILDSAAARIVAWSGNNLVCAVVY